MNWQGWLCWIAVTISVAFFYGCRQHIAASGVDSGPAAGVFDFRTKLSFETNTFEFTSHKNRRVIRVAVRYTADVPAIGRTAEVQRAFALKTPETTWLLVYLQHQALQWLNGHAIPDGLSVEVLSDHSAAEGRPWWIAGWEKGEFSPSTLALRDGQDVLAMLSGGEPQLSDWQPLTPGSYEEWYRALDQRLRLSEVFGPPAEPRIKAMPSAAPTQVDSADIHPARSTERIRRLVEMGRQGYAWVYVDEKPFMPAEIETMVDHVLGHQDASSFHLIFTLREVAPERYAKLPPSAKASILCAGLARQVTLNDWNPLPEYPSNELAAYEADSAMAALVATGHAALSTLLPLLDDKRLAFFHGSKEATVSTESRYRRCDFAHRAAALILGWPYVLKKDLAERDRDIEVMRKQVRQHLAAKTARPATAPA
jgi:hypothetical protein